MIELPTVSFAAAHDVLRVSIMANQSVLLLGDPGVGKSAIIAKLAKELDMPLHILLGSTLDPTDIGGLPVVRLDGKGVDRCPLRAIQEASEKPCILFLDEISAAPLPVQAAMLRLVLERVAGDVVLHPESRVVAAANPPEQAPGGFDLSAPLMGRVCALHFRPTEDEVLTYLATMGDEDSPEREEGRLFAAVAACTPELLQIDIPKECVTGGRPWGAPRSWERVIRARAAAQKLGGVSPEVDKALMAGSVGSACATSYRAICDLIGELPSVEEIVESPTDAKIPTDRHKQVAAVGLIGRVADKNLWAAYIYCARLFPEYGMAAHKILMTMSHKQPSLQDKHAQAGVKARVQLTAGVKRFR